MRFIFFALALVLVQSLLFLDPGYALTPSQENGIVVLFAQNHEELYGLELGEPTELAGFASLLMEQGMEVLSLAQGDLDAEFLEGVDVLVISYPQEEYDPEEIAAVEGYVARGGGLVVLGGQKCRDYVNPLLKEFGMEMGYGVIQVNGDADLLLEAKGHEVFSYVEDFEYLRGPSVGVENPEWIIYPAPTMEDQALFATRSYGEGLVFASGDADFLNDVFLERYDNSQLGVNIIRHAAGREATKLERGMHEGRSLFPLAILALSILVLILWKIR